MKIAKAMNKGDNALATTTHKDHTIKIITMDKDHFYHDEDSSSWTAWYHQCDIGSDEAWIQTIFAGQPSQRQP